MAVAYHSDMRKAAPDAQIVAVTHHWGDYYVRRVQARARRPLEERQLLGRRQAGAWCAPATSAPRCRKAVQDEVLARQGDIAKGKLRPFAGPIVDNEGKQVLAARPGDDR